MKVAGTKKKQGLSGSVSKPTRTAVEIHREKIGTESPPEGTA